MQQTGFPVSAFFDQERLGAVGAGAVVDDAAPQRQAEPPLRRSRRSTGTTGALLRPGSRWR